MRRILDGLYSLSALLAGVLVIGICAIVSAQVALNVLSKIMPAVSWTIPSYADIAGFMLAGASFLALAPTLRSGGHIRVTLIVRRLPPKLQVAAELVALAIGVGLTGYALRYSIRLVHDSLRFHDMSNGIIAIPLWIPQLGVVIGLAVLLIALVDLLVESCLTRRKVLTASGEL